MATPALVFLEPGTAEWDRVWAMLTSETGGDLAERCQLTGEVWQYMGSFSDCGETYHEFRHRNCPRTGRREYRRFTDSGAAVYLGRWQTT